MTRRFSIAMVAACPLPYPRGTPIRIHRMASTLAQRGHDVHVITYHLGDDIDDAPYHLHRISNVPTYRKLSPGPTWQKLMVLDALLAMKLRSVMKRVNVDLIHAHHYEGLLAALAVNRRARLPVVFDVHTLLESELPFYRLGLFARAKRRIGRAFDERLPARADHIIAVTETIRDRLVELGRVPNERISVIGNGVNWEVFDLPRGEATGNGRAKTAIFTGNLASYQGIELMLRSFAHLARDRTNVKLRLVTESSFDPYATLARELEITDRIDVIHAPFAEVPGHMAASDVALNPRVACDGLPQKLLNYMAGAMPIVSFEGSAKGLTHEHDALIAPDGDVAAFGDAIARLFDDAALSRMLGQNARERVRRTMSWQSTAERVEKVYDALIAQSCEVAR